MAPAESLVPCSNGGFCSTPAAWTRRFPRTTLFSSLEILRSSSHYRLSYRNSTLIMRARAETQEEPQVTESTEPSPPASSPSSLQKQSLLEALDFSVVRSPEDAQLLEDARAATNLGEKMSREQYAALRRKVGGTYRDFFKDSIEVDGEYVDEGWVDKTCRFCKKDTASEPRTIDKYGRYAHVACLEKSKSGNFFTRLFGM